MATIRFDHMDAITEGFHYTFPELKQSLLNNEWYAARYNSLLPKPYTTQNGMLLLRSDEVTDESEVYLPSGIAGRNSDNLVIYEYHKLASDFIGQAAIAELPVYASESAAVIEWLDEWFIQVDKALRDATRYWSIHDRAVLTAEQGPDGIPLIRAVNPANYIRIGELAQPDALVGHVLIFPYREPESIDEAKTHTNLRPNRVRVQYFIKDQLSIIRTFQYDGSVVFGRMISEEQSPVRAICVAGNGDSWYDGSADIVSRLLIMQSLIIRAINRFENRIRFVPQSVIDEIRQSGGSPKTLTQVARTIEDIVNPYLGLREEEQPPQFSLELLELQSHMEAYNSLLDQFFLMSGVPPSSFGIGIGRGESGIAREKGQDAASSRARAYRRDLTQCLREICVGAGMPDEDVAFTWIGTPFESESARSDRAMMLFEKGIIDRNEARLMMGFTETEDEDMEAQNGNAEDPSLRQRAGEDTNGR